MAGSQSMGFIETEGAGKGKCLTVTPVPRAFSPVQ
jgi:hypothetical protein